MSVTRQVLVYDTHMLPRMFEDMLRKMPVAYRRNPRAMKLYVSPAIAAAYREVLAKRIGGAAWLEVETMRYAGIPIIIDEGQRGLTTLTERAMLCSYDAATRAFDYTLAARSVTDARQLICRLRYDIREHYRNIA